MLPAMRTTLFVSATLASLMLAACGSDGTGPTPGDPDASNGTPDAPPPPEGFTRLIGRTWSLPGGSLDRYKCVRVTIPEDMYITNIMAQAPAGTHHTVLSIADNARTQGADGEQDCQVSTLGTVMLYASGVGTSPLDFPDGVGIKVSAGTQIHLNLHLFNASDNELSGDSGILVKAQATPPPTLAEMVFAGKFLFQIPPNTANHVVENGGCTVNTPYQLFAVWPHMHQFATHQKVELLRGNTTTVLHDLPYSFEEQTYFLQNPEVSVEAGDRIRVTCTYTNNTNQTIRFGDSSTEEMCFAGLYRYPATGANLFQCTDTGGIGF